MTTIEVIAYGTLWVMLMTLGALVLLLYRQLEKVYSGSDAAESGLKAGERTSSVEIATSLGTEVFDMPDQDRPMLIAFISTTCEACRDLVSALRSEAQTDSVILFVAGEKDEEFAETVAGIAALWLAHPFDAERAYGISAYPTTFLVQNGVIVGSTTKTSKRAIGDLMLGTQTKPVRESSEQEETHVLDQV